MCGIEEVCTPRCGCKNVAWKPCGQKPENVCESLGQKNKTAKQKLSCSLVCDR